MEITKCYFAFFTIVLTFMCTETAGYRADRFRQELSYIREDISALFEITDQLNISVVESCGPCVSGNTSYPPLTKHNGRQDMVKVSSNKALLKYRRLIKAFGSEKQINRELQHQLRSMENSFSASEKVAKENTRNQHSQLQSMEASILEANERYREQQRRLQSMEASISAANERYRKQQRRLQSMEASISDNKKVANRLRSLEESVEDKISNMYQDLRNITSFMTAIKDALQEAILVKKDKCKSVPESGVYTLHLDSIMSPVNVYCDQETDGGGWIVFMRRQDGSVNFYRPWLDYKHGFGSLDGEFWAGNELLYKLTKEKPMQLRIDMQDFDGNTAFAMYEEFQIGAETDKYRLHVSGYSGTAGDSLIDTANSGSKHAGMQFSTFDSDNDKSRSNCAYALSSGWWYNTCFYADLNAPYSQDKTIAMDKGVIWYSWKQRESLKRVEMKIR